LQTLLTDFDPTDTSRRYWPMPARCSPCALTGTDHGGCVVPIPGTRRLDRIEENVVAANTRLDERDLSRLEELYRAPAGRVTAGPSPYR
jgi:hypothetical protein